MMITKEQIVALLRNSAESLTKVTLYLGDKATWSPLDRGRTAANQVAECAFLTGGAAHAVETGAFPTTDFEAYTKETTVLGDNPEQALALLRQNMERLCRAVEASTPERWTVVVELPWGEKVSLLEMLLLIYRTNIYHEGQIYYAVTLVGD
jgi:DinB family